MRLRTANPGDFPGLQALIEASVRALSIGFYSPEQIEAALTHVFGVDSQLIRDQTYYVIETAGQLVAAGGWSGRRTLYGGDQAKGPEDARLNPSTEAARIRAFFVHPLWARQGLARRIYEECRRAAWAAGFRRFELMATRPGEPLYLSLGFTVVEEVVERLPGGVAVPFSRMALSIEPQDVT